MTDMWDELIESGSLAFPESLARVDDVTRADGTRLLQIRVAGGLAVDVCPARGLDLGAAWWGTTPLAWRSMNRVDPGPGHGWEDRFLGGLLATCGPDNIGTPRGTSGQHGTHHLTPAYDVRWNRERTDDGWQVTVRGTVPHTTFTGPRILVEREIVAATGAPSVTVRDTVRNVGDHSVGVPLLYHINLGAPLLRPGARLALGSPPVADAAPAVVREPLPPGRDPLVTPAPAPGLVPVVAEHPQVPGARATLLGDDTHPDVVVTWTNATLPRLFTWSWPASGAYVLGVEPANAPLFGPERDLPFGGAPVLEPGQTWQTGVRIAVEQRPR